MEQDYNQESPPSKIVELKDIELELDLELKDLQLCDQRTADTDRQLCDQRTADTDRQLCDQRTTDTDIPKPEIIDYDEALRRAGGFGAYQALMFLAISIFNMYGDQIIFNFVYLSSPHKNLCKYPGEDSFSECTKEEFCENYLTPGFLSKPLISDKDYIFGLTGAYPEINCLPQTSVAFMGQLWFTGFLLKVGATPLQEKVGHLKFLKYGVIPLNILCFQLQFLNTPYFLRCFGFLIAGFCKIKHVTFLILLQDSVKGDQKNFATTFYLMFYFSVIASFCTYVQYMSKNVMTYLHFTNAITIFCGIIIMAFAVDSPKRNIENGQAQDGKKSLQYISKFNAYFSMESDCKFENVKIYLTRQEVLNLKNQHMNDQWSPVLTDSNSQVTQINKGSVFSLLKQILRDYKLVFSSFILIITYINIIWFLTIYGIQGSQTQDTSIFFNGMILGCVSMTAISTSGLLLRYFNPLSLQLTQAIICFFITVFLLLIVIYKDKMTDDQLQLASRLKLFFSYVTMYSVDQQYNCWMQSVGLILPPSFLVLALELQMAISIGFTQLIPYIILMEDLSKQIFQLSLTVGVVIAYVHIWVKGNRK